MGGSVSRYPDGQLAMRAIDNGAGHACSELYLFINVRWDFMLSLTGCAAGFVLIFKDSSEGFFRNLFQFQCYLYEMLTHILF